jgi:hypothetical protein
MSILSSREDEIDLATNLIDGNNFSSHELGKWKKVNILKFEF